MPPSEIVWRPTPEHLEGSRIARFMRAQGIASLADLQRRSVEDPAWYWDAVARDLGVRFSRPYERVVDLSRGVMWARWFTGGLLNLADNCLDRNLDAGRAAKVAIVAEGDDGAIRRLSYAELARDVSRFANALRSLGLERGDRIGIFLPMSPESAIAMLAAARIGAVSVPASRASAPRRSRRASRTARRRRSSRPTGSAAAVSSCGRRTSRTRPSRSPRACGTWSWRDGSASTSPGRRAATAPGTNSSRRSRIAATPPRSTPTIPPSSSTPRARPDVRRAPSSATPGSS